MPFHPGEVIAVRVYGIFWHVGIVTPWSTVISSSRRHGGVTEQGLNEFAGGKPIRRVGYPGQLPSHTVVARASSQLGRPWKLFDANCEHFALWAHGLNPESPQLKTALGVFALVTLMGVIARA